MVGEGCSSFPQAGLGSLLELDAWPRCFWLGVDVSLGSGEKRAQVTWRASVGRATEAGP